MANVQADALYKATPDKIRLGWSGHLESDTADLTVAKPSADQTGADR